MVRNPQDAGDSEQLHVTVSRSRALDVVMPGLNGPA